MNLDFINNINFGAILNNFLALPNKPFFSFLFYFFIRGGWVIFFFVGCWAFAVLFKERMKTIQSQNMKYVLLSIDVPKDNENGPEVTERLFAHLATAGSTSGLVPAKTLIKPSFSFEIISDSGKIHFLVRAQEQYHDLVEAAFYGEYPNAEIKEVEDYTTNFPDRFPDPEYDIWGAEIVLYNKDVYPIRTYEAFEHKLSGEFRDPMSNVLEVLGKVKEGEKIWMQIIITFGGLGWKIKGQKLVNELIGKRAEKSGGGGLSDLLGNFVSKGLGSIANLGYEVLSGGESVGESEGTFKGSKEPPPSLMTYLSPGQKDTVSSVEKKISKIGFKTKFRVIYIAQKDIFYVHRAVPGILGALNQFNTLDLNGFKPDDYMKTQVSPYDFFPQSKLKKRKNEIMKGYKKRSISRGSNPYILNIEELATIFHFPVISVIAPLVKKTGSKRGEPPFALPVKNDF